VSQRPNTSQADRDRIEDLGLGDNENDRTEDLAGVEEAMPA
jgi:hypothetical protein